MLPLTFEYCGLDWRFLSFYTKTKTSLGENYRATRTKEEKTEGDDGLGSAFVCLLSNITVPSSLPRTDKTLQSSRYN